MLHEINPDANRHRLHPRFDRKQGPSGLGMEAQEAAIAAFCTQHGYEIAAQYGEVETGKGHDALDRRPSWPPHWRTPASSRPR